MNAIKITIGGRLDRSITDSFATIRKMSRDASGAVDRDWNKRRGSVGVNPELAAARAAHAEQSRLNRDIFKQEMAARKDLDKQARQLARDRTREELNAIRARQREERAALRERERSERQMASAAMSLDRQRGAAMYRQFRGRERELDRLATRTSHRTTRFMFPRPEGALGYASRTANDIMRGMGIDTTLAGGVRRATDMQKQAYFLSSKGYFAGEKGPAGNRIDPEKLISEARAIGDKQAFDPSVVLESQAAYVGLTGDLETARALMGDLAALSGATGSEMTDLGRAAGAMGNALGESAQVGSEKANVLLGVMRVLASQGKLTAIEMDTLAKHMPKLAGASRMYGDVAGTMAQFGALGQLSMGGGAWNAASATTAMAGFTSEIMSSKSQKHLKSYGVKSYDPKTKMLRSPIELIKEIVEKTGGDQSKISKIVSGTRGGRMVNWLSAEYRRTGSWESTDKRVGQLMNASALSKENVDAINAKRMETTAAKAQKFQNNLDKITETMASKLIPAMEQLAPTALKIASAFGNFLTWATENPGKLIAGAISLAIMRALTESLFRGLLDNVIRRTGGGGGGGGLMGGPMGGRIAAAGAGLAIGAGVYAAIDYAGKSNYDEGVKGTNDINAGIKDAHGSQLGQAIIDAEAKLQKLKDDQGLFGGFMDLFGAGSEADIKGSEDLISRKKAEYEQFRQTGKLSKGDVAEIKAREMVNGWAGQKETDYAALAKATADGLKGQTLNVRVTNTADMKTGSAGAGPEVDESGRKSNGK